LVHNRKENRHVQCISLRTCQVVC